MYSQSGQIIESVAKQAPKERHKPMNNKHLQTEETALAPALLTGRSLFPTTSCSSPKGQRHVRTLPISKR